MRFTTYLLLCLMLPASLATAQDTPRKTTSLDGKWTFHREGSKETKAVTLPTHWETHEGLKFDGIGWYEKTIELPELPIGRRLLLHFDAVATHATVYWNDVKLGEHLGGWTPFRFDVTEHLSGGRQPPEPARPAKDGKENANAKTQGADAPRSRKHTIKVRVDEKVGHNTQGFLPIIAPHFGGIWQGVRLIEVPETYIDDLKLVLLKSNEQNQWRLRIPVKERVKDDVMGITVEEVIQHQYLHNSAASHGFWLDDGAINVEFQLKQAPWTPESPKRSKLKITIVNRNSEDTYYTWVSTRTITTQGDQFLLNGQPLSIRGVLNWGYYPPSLAPAPTEEQWRSDLKLIKSWGFNLMKCCLWVPPKRLLEIADEEGVLLWIEYPTWHPKLTPQFQKELMQEYKEFHELDRNHPSVILRSLTCETGPGADIKVIQALYDQCKKMAGGLVVDDSSWIEWNRVFDFYDDHPYGNNHTWVATLDRLKKYIATSKYGVKPLCLGEAIAADTWVPTQPMLDAIAKAKADPKQAWSFDERGYPFWVPGFFDANRKWLERMGRVCGGAVDEEKLYQDSLKYAQLMRKDQIETYRATIPHGGYVVSVLRDFPLASMGLLDYHGLPKWHKEKWSWHREKPNEIVGSGFGMDFPKDDKFVTVEKLSVELLDILEKGGNVLLRPSKSAGSMPLRSHWFLRGGPFVNEHHPVMKEERLVFEIKRKLRDYLVEEQAFELASDVVPDINYLEEIDPILMLWDNHDIKEVKTHGLIFETRVGKGRLVVATTSFHYPEVNILVSSLFRNCPPPRNALKPETIARMRAKLNEKKLELVSKSWQFLPDGKNEGLQLGYEKPGFDDKAWKPIKIGQHWEGQGYPTLDGWAWYRLTVEVPKDWIPPHPQPLSPQGRGETWYLNTEGVDDAYEIYVNGTKVGQGGDIPNKKTAFEERAAHRIPAGVLKPGEKNVIAVRVYDWYGAGGIHRPMTLSNVPIGGMDILK